MTIFYDQLDRPVELLSAPKRIISLVPSQTELLFYLGLGEEIVGITKFCTRPSDKVKSKIKIGGTKSLNINLIKELNPDLIIGNKEENEKEQIEELSDIYPVWISNVNNLVEAMVMIHYLGLVVKKNTKANKLCDSILKNFHSLPQKGESKLRVAYLIWRKPYIIAGKGTFIGDMLTKCGLINAFDTERYPEINSEQLVDTNPDVILLSSEPYPFKEKHITEFKALLPNATIKLVDGELFSWYGSRLLYAPAYLNSLLHEINR